MRPSLPASRANPAGGLSLLETLLAAGLAALFFAVVAQVMIPSMRLVMTSSVRTGLQQQTRMALERIERDLRRSSAYGVSMLPSSAPNAPVVLAIHRLSDRAFTGSQLWEEQLMVYCYHPDAHSLTQASWPPQPPAAAVTFTPTRPVAVPAAELVKFGSTPTGREATLARNVAAFKVTRSTAGAYTLTLELREEQPGKRVESYGLTRTLFLRTH